MKIEPCVSDERVEQLTTKISIPSRSEVRDLAREVQARRDGALLFAFEVAAFVGCILAGAHQFSLTISPELWAKYAADAHDHPALSAGMIAFWFAIAAFYFSRARARVRRAAVGQ